MVNPTVRSFNIMNELFFSQEEKEAAHMAALLSGCGGTETLIKIKLLSLFVR